MYFWPVAITIQCICGLLLSVLYISQRKMAFCVLLPNLLIPTPLKAMSVFFCKENPKVIPARIIRNRKDACMYLMVWLQLPPFQPYLYFHCFPEYIPLSEDDKIEIIYTGVLFLYGLWTRVLIFAITVFFLNITHYPEVYMPFDIL